MQPNNPESLGDSRREELMAQMAAAEKELLILEQETSQRNDAYVMNSYESADPLDRANAAQDQPEEMAIHRLADKANEAFANGDRTGVEDARALMAEQWADASVTDLILGAKKAHDAGNTQVLGDIETILVDKAAAQAESENWTVEQQSEFIDRTMKRIYGVEESTESKDPAVDSTEQNDASQTEADATTPDVEISDVDTTAEESASDVEPSLDSNAEVAGDSAAAATEAEPNQEKSLVELFQDVAVAYESQDHEASDAIEEQIFSLIRQQAAAESWPPEKLEEHLDTVEAQLDRIWAAARQGSPDSSGREEGQVPNDAEAIPEPDAEFSDESLRSRVGSIFKKAKEGSLLAYVKARNAIGDYFSGTDVELVDQYETGRRRKIVAAVIGVTTVAALYMNMRRGTTMNMPNVPEEAQELFAKPSATPTPEKVAPLFESVSVDSSDGFVQTFIEDFKLNKADARELYEQLRPGLKGSEGTYMVGNDIRISKAGAFEFSREQQQIIEEFMKNKK